MHTKSTKNTNKKVFIFTLHCLFRDCLVVFVTLVCCSMVIDGRACVACQ